MSLAPFALKLCRPSLIAVVWACVWTGCGAPALDADGGSVADAGAAADAEPLRLDPSARAAGTVTRAPGATGEGFGDPTQAIDGVRGAGPSGGSLNVYSLDFGSRTELVLEWDGLEIHDGPGVDFVVFENAFRQTGASTNFMDPAVVWVSRDAETWVPLPHVYSAPDPTRYSGDPDHWQGFAGVHPVLLHEESNPVDPFDVVAAGGDGFDLSDLPLDEDARVIRERGFIYLRITPAALEIDSRTTAPYPRDPISNGPDIDGVYARYTSPRRP